MASTLNPTSSSNPSPSTSSSTTSNNNAPAQQNNKNKKNSSSFLTIENILSLIGFTGIGLYCKSIVDDEKRPIHDRNIIPPDKIMSFGDDVSCFKELTFWMNICYQKGGQHSKGFLQLLEPLNELCRLSRIITEDKVPVVLVHMSNSETEMLLLEQIDTCLLTIQDDVRMMQNPNPMYSSTVSATHLTSNHFLHQDTTPPSNDVSGGGTTMIITDINQYTSFLHIMERLKRTIQDIFHNVCSRRNALVHLPSSESIL